MPTKNAPRLSAVPFFLLLLVSLLGVVYPGVPKAPMVKDGIVAGDVAWMLCSAGLVLLMTPGLALFYGGMVSTRNVISTMLQSFICMGVISVLWIVVGFSLAFGDSIGGIIGDPRTYFMFRGVLESKPWPLASTVPLVLFAFFQLKFAVISPALITGSFSERIRFTSYILFACLFSMLIYAPIAHWTWHPDGILFKMGVLDFAGGTVVHISAGCSALAAAIYLRNRKQGQLHLNPSNIPFVLTGTGLLWFGWFGFNAGSAVGANDVAASALATTNTSAAAAGMAWILFDAFKGKKPSALGFSIGAVVGLVAITPSAGFVTIAHSIFIGTATSIISNMVVAWTAKTSIDDTLDVFPCHGVGAMVGMLFTGIFAHQTVNPANTTGNGLLYGETKLFLAHLAGLGIVVAFSFVGAFALLKITDLISPLRVSKDEEIQGLDITQHGEQVSMRA
ncbi:ammonium transporter [Cnuella takakiae]|uniref:Ammonium transporter n=1 Tax=Cnuella takakiae TaxID=1302690 RepID=A0A1M5IAT4_9BACT|nr:ammonium transporter [Cnuella takakiae]OLY90780.1 ammonia channel protein [Cnuella takakiae]SHG25474.1 ammonium transporter [Cnuella takakiae]